MDSFERFKQLMSSINFDPAVVVGVVAFILTFIIASQHSTLIERSISK